MDCCITSNDLKDLRDILLETKTNLYNWILRNKNAGVLVQGIDSQITVGYIVDISMEINDYPLTFENATEEQLEEFEELMSGISNAIE